MLGLVLATSLITSRADFQAIEFLPEALDCNVTLTTSVPARCKAKLSKTQTYPVWKTNLDFDFGQISREQWETLRSQYTGPWAGPKILDGQTPLFEPHDAQHRYTLKDFLPLTVRALADYYFIEERPPLPQGVALPEEPPAAPALYGKSILVPNCWTTVYETLRTIQRGREDEADAFLDVFSTDDKDAQQWLQSATVAVPGEYTAIERKFGDVMLISLQQDTMFRPILEHAVIFVDHNVVFEKAGTGAKNPYRLIDLATVEKEWQPSLQGGLFKWSLRRPLLGAEQGKTFAEQFSLQAMKPDARWPEFWQWPAELQASYTLGRADNPTDAKFPVDGLTLMTVRRYGFQKNGSGWTPQRVELATEAQQPSISV